MTKDEKRAPYKCVHGMWDTEHCCHCQLDAERSKGNETPSAEPKLAALMTHLRERHCYLVGIGAKETYEGTAHAVIESKAARIAELEAEIVVSDKLIAERNRLLEAVPHCPSHGACVPHAIEWVEARRAQPPSEALRDAKRLKDYFDNANCITHPSLYYSSAEPFTAWCHDIDEFIAERADVAAATKKASPVVSESEIVIDIGHLEPVYEVPGDCTSPIVSSRLSGETLAPLFKIGERVRLIGITTISPHDKWAVVSLPFKTESNGLYVVKHDSGSRMCVLAENMERTESAAPLLCCPKYQNLVCNGACKEAGESRG